MSTRLSLQRPARRRVQKLDRRSTSADQRIRCRVVLKVAAGRSCNAASRELGCAPSTAVRIVARFRAEGEAALLDRRNANGWHKIDADVRGGVCEILTGTPADHGFTRPTWTLEILRSVVEQLLARIALVELAVDLAARAPRALGTTPADRGLSVANAAPAAADCGTSTAGRFRERGERGGLRR